jgi:hypothetical protein
MPKDQSGTVAAKASPPSGSERRALWVRRLCAASAIEVSNRGLEAFTRGRAVR